jgi:plastocyanin
MPRKSLLALVVLAAIALAIVGAAFGRNSSTPTLKGVVGPGFSVKLTMGGKKVKSLKAGTYKFVIRDKSAFHNFTVEREKPTKPKIEKHITSTGFTGSKTLVMKLKAGSWSYYCSVHEPQMHGDFKVTK